MLELELIIVYIADGTLDRNAANVDREGRFCMFGFLRVVSKLVIEATRRQFKGATRNPAPHFRFVLQFASEKVMLLWNLDGLENLDRQHIHRGITIVEPYIDGTKPRVQQRISSLGCQ